MGTCTSSIKRRQKQYRERYKRPIPENSTVRNNKQLLTVPFTILPNQHPHSSLTNFSVVSSPLTELNFHQSETGSLIQLYSTNTNNNNSNINNSMSSSTSHVPPRIPVPKSRLPIHQSTSTSTGSIRPGNIPPTVGITNPTGINRPMSITNRASVPPPSQTTTQPRLGFIPRPTAPGLQQTQSLSVAARSRSISPSSTASANSSTSISQRLAKTQTVQKNSSNRSAALSSSATSNTAKSKPPPSPHNNKDSSTSKSTTATNRLRSNTTPLTAHPPPVLPNKTDVNAIRDRYKTQKRMNFFTRRTPPTNSLKSPSNETSVIQEEKNEQSSTDEQTASTPIDSQNEDLKTESSQQASSSPGDSAYTSTASAPNRPPSAQTSQTNHQRQRATSTVSSSSHLSDIRNQDALLDDDNCSLKSDDLICDYDETLTLDSVSKNDQTDSCSSNSLSIETNKKPTMITTVTTITKPNIPPFQSVLKDHRSSTIAKCSTGNKTNDNLRESLDELTRLSTRMDGIVDNEHNRRLVTRSVSLKPPPTSLPPREDAEQITMDVESYRQVMKDVMVVKTILHQLDRLLKHSDGANMTDSMVGSFHESMISSRHFSSSSGDGNFRNSIDENSSYDDLFKEILILRKEKEQDKQTIKLLQEQMYKYSSQTNDS